MGDHTEVVELDFDVELVSYQALLRHFWQTHNPNRKRYRDREYISLVLYHNEKQQELAEKIKKEQEQVIMAEVQTEIAPYQGFTAAVERQQKWHIKRVPHAIEQLNRLYPTNAQLINATLAARLNSLAKGYGDLEIIKQETEQWEIDEKSRQNIRRALNQMQEL